MLLYDGTCGFCNRTVHFVLRRDRRGELFFAALQSSFARAVVARTPELAGVDSVVWVELDAAGLPRRARVRSDALLEVARYLGGGWSLLAAARLVPRALRDRAYDLFARHRHRVPGDERCLLPTPEQRARFLDD